MALEQANTILQSLNGWKRTHQCNELNVKHIDQEVCLMGWAQYRRDHGGLIFIDLRDKEGMTQVVFSPEHNLKAHSEAHVLRSEYVLAVKGTVRRRPEGMENFKLKTGEIEVVVLDWKLLNTSNTPPFMIEKNLEVSENLRLQYRYIDLRRDIMNKNLVLRHKSLQAIRKVLNSNDFLEIETPLLTKSTPEGARDFLVPSRLQQGEFFALPQSPQLYKQLLMYGGIERYYQIVKCFRDEDLRADRQPEFTQLDLEMSFAEEDDIMDISEKIISNLFYETLGAKVKTPFKHLTYDQALKYYGLDSPDTRFGLELVDVSDIVKNSNFKLFANSELIKAICIPGGDELTRKEIDDLTEYVKIFGATGLAWIKVKNSEWQSPIAKFLSSDEKQVLEQRISPNQGDIIFFQAGNPDMVNSALGNLRLSLGKRFNLIPRDRYAFVWITDFPLMEWAPEDKSWAACHHPFTAPRERDVHLLEETPQNARARAYDLVVNGNEIGGGSIRIHRPELQMSMFKALGISTQEAQSKFGFLMEALNYGAPPHGGIAFGLDRIIMILSGSNSIRDIIAFPKTQKGICPVTNAPTNVNTEQLQELGIKIRHKKQETKESTNS